MRQTASEVIRVVVRCTVATLLGLFVLAAYSSVTVIADRFPGASLSNQWARGCVSPVAGSVVCMLLMLALGKGRLSDYGFRGTGSTRWGRITLLGLAVGVAAALFGPLLDIERNVAAENLSFPQTVVMVWLAASIFEELLTRGLIQSFLAPLAKHGFTLSTLRISLPVLASALFFGLMHLGLLSLGMGLYSVLYIVLFALVLGLLAGYYREKTGSLVPAIVVHGLANVGGTCTDYLIELVA